MSVEKKSTVGNPKKLTDSARKRNCKDVLARYAKTKINIGKEHDRWCALKEVLNVGTHAEMARVPLDR